MYDSYTLSVDADIFVSAQKKLRIQKSPDTCGRGLTLTFKSVFSKWYSLIAPDVTAAMLVERTIVKTSFGNLTVLLCKT